MAALYRNRKYGKGNLFKKKRFKSSGKKFIKKRIKIILQIIAFDFCSAPGHPMARTDDQNIKKTSISPMYFNDVEHKINARLIMPSDVVFKPNSYSMYIRS